MDEHAPRGDAAAGSVAGADPTAAGPARGTFPGDGEGVAHGPLGMNAGGGERAGDGDGPYVGLPASPPDDPPAAAAIDADDRDDATSADGAPVDPAHARDTALITLARDGDLDAFNSLVVLHQDHLVALATRVCGEREAAEDAVQEAFYSAYRNLHRFRGGSVRAWLTRITLNAATDVLRSRKRRPADRYPELEDESWEPRAGETADPERETIRRAQGRVLQEALRQLTEGQRTAILLFDVEGYDYPEIAELTGVSLGTVKSRIHRGRLALRELLSTSMELFRT